MRRAAHAVESKAVVRIEVAVSPFIAFVFFALSRVSHYHYALCLPKPHAAAWAPQAGGRRRVSPCTAVQDEIDNSVPV
jgi:hypothetical protein